MSDQTNLFIDLYLTLNNRTTKNNNNNKNIKIPAEEQSANQRRESELGPSFGFFLLLQVCSRALKPRQHPGHGAEGGVAG